MCHRIVVECIEQFLRSSSRTAALGESLWKLSKSIATEIQKLTDLAQFDLFPPHPTNTAIEQVLKLSIPNEVDLYELLRHNEEGW